MPHAHAHAHACRYTPQNLKRPTELSLHTTRADNLECQNRAPKNCIRPQPDAGGFVIFYAANNKGNSAGRPAAHHLRLNHHLPRPVPTIYPSGTSKGRRTRMPDWGSPQHNAGSSATSRGHRSGRDSPIEGGGSFPLTEEQRAAPQHLPVQLQRGLCARRLAIPFLTLVALAVLVVRNNSLPAAEQPSPGWARTVAPAGARVTTPQDALGGATALGVQQEAEPAQLRAAPPDNQQSVQSSAQKCVSVRTCLRNGDPNVPRFACWAVARYAELEELQRADMSEYERCLWRSDSLTSAKQACEQAQGWCGGIVRDNGIYCSVRGHSRKMVYELRRGGRAVPHAERTTWQPQRNASISCASATESTYREEGPSAASGFHLVSPQQDSEGPRDNVWWSSASDSASSSAAAASATESTRRLYDDPPPPPPPPPRRYRP
jgi:hypothetical protein